MQQSSPAMALKMKASSTGKSKTNACLEQEIYTDWPLGSLEINGALTEIEVLEITGAKAAPGLSWNVDLMLKRANPLAISDFSVQRSNWLNDYMMMVMSEDNGLTGYSTVKICAVDTQRATNVLD